MHLLLSSVLVSPVHALQAAALVAAQVTLALPASHCNEEVG
jgi:hypothetical protein